ncbi:AraC family transcriptional regulator ligand-binding domain-containing protein [Amycolatopsis sp. NPDC003676]
MDHPAVLDALAQRLARIGERRNLDVPALLHRLGIPPDRTDVARRQVSELTRELWLQTDDELFALGPRAPRGLFRLVVRSVAPAPDLRTALHRLEEATHVLPGMPAVAIRAAEPLADAAHVPPGLPAAAIRATDPLEEATHVPPGLPAITTRAAEPLVEVEIDVRRLGDPERVAAELVAMVVHRLLGWLPGQRIDLRELRLPRPKPDHAPHYELVFGRSLSRGDESIEKLAFPEASAFRRAFRRWTGQAPADYR